MSINKSFQSPLHKSLSQQIKHFNPQKNGQNQSISNSFFRPQASEEQKKTKINKFILLNKRLIKQQVLRQVEEWSASDYFTNQFQIQYESSDFSYRLYNLMGEVYELMLNKFATLHKQKQRQIQQQPTKQCVTKTQNFVRIIKRIQVKANPSLSCQDLFYSILRSIKMIIDHLQQQSLQQGQNKKGDLIKTIIDGSQKQIILEIKAKLAFSSTDRYENETKQKNNYKDLGQVNKMRNEHRDDSFEFYSDQTFNVQIGRQKKLKKRYSRLTLQNLLSKDQISVMIQRLQGIKNKQVRQKLISNLCTQNGILNPIQQTQKLQLNQQNKSDSFKTGQKIGINQQEVMNRVQKKLEQQLKIQEFKQVQKHQSSPNKVNSNQI